MARLAPGLLLALAACRGHDGVEGTPPPPRASAPARPVPAAPSSGADASRDDTPQGAPPTSVATDWCTDGMPALAEDVCYVLPGGANGAPKALLVYLHGIVPPVPDSPQKRTVQRAVLAASTRAGFAALVPRGRRGIGPGHERDWWAWPTTAEAHAQLTSSIVARWVDAKRALEDRTGAPFERTYLAGSSNGAFYVTALALHGDVPTTGFPVDGFGAMSGGGASSGPAARAEPRPFYVGFGTYDAESSARARSLAALLRAARWPVRLAEHPFGHGAHEEYLDEAFSFWGSFPELR